MRSVRLLCASLAAGIVSGLLAFPAHSSQTDNVWVEAMGPRSEFFLETASASNQVTDPLFGVGGIGSASASISDGYLRVSVESINRFIGTNLNEGNASATAALNTRIFLNGPTDVGGNVLVTMNVNGTWTSGSVNAFNEVVATSGYGLGSVGRASMPDSFGDFGLFETTVSGVTTRDMYLCHNCSGASNPGVFPLSVTAVLPFSAGQSFVDYTAQLALNTRGGLIDASHTATFSILMPEGFSYTSALAFQAPVPEPSTYGMLLAGVGMLASVVRRRLGPTLSA